MLSSIRAPSLTRSSHGDGGGDDWSVKSSDPDAKRERCGCQFLSPDRRAGWRLLNLERGPATMNAADK